MLTTVEVLRACLRVLVAVAAAAAAAATYSDVIALATACTCTACVRSHVNSLVTVTSRHSSALTSRDTQNRNTC